MLGPDVVSAASRIGPVQVENRSVWVQTPVAQQLGLRDGQIVQATVEVRDQRVRLWLKDFFFDLPNGWVLKDGDKPFLRVNHNPGGWGFLIQAFPNGQAPVATATPVNQLFGLNPTTAEPPTSEMAPPEPQSNRLGMLLMRCGPRQLGGSSRDRTVAATPFAATQLLGANEPQHAAQSRHGSGSQH
jgi:hypothetical protein